MAHAKQLHSPGQAAWVRSVIVGLALPALVGVTRTSQAEPPPAASGTAAAALATAPPGSVELSPPLHAAAPPAPTPVSLAPSPPPPQSSRDSGDMTLAYAGFGTAIAGAVVGGISGVLALSKTSQLRTDCGGTVCPASKQSDIDSARNMAGLSTVSFAIALIGVVVGVNGLAVASGPSTQTSAATQPLQVRPMVGLGSAGLEGSF